MALVLKDRIRSITSTGGTGTVALGAAIPGYQAFSVVGDGNTTYYTIVDSTTGDWETGVGDYIAATNSLTRGLALESSNNNALVNFAEGTKDIFVSLPASRAVYNNADGSLVYDPAGSAIVFAIALG